MCGLMPPILSAQPFKGSYSVLCALLLCGAVHCRTFWVIGRVGVGWPLPLPLAEPLPRGLACPAASAHRSSCCGARGARHVKRVAQVLRVAVWLLSGLC